MAILPQRRPSSWENLETLDDLHRPRLALETVPALGRVRENRPGKMRSLVGAA